MKNIGVVGSGSWGLAIANHMAEMGNNVIVWSFTEEEKNSINSKHKTHLLPDVTLNQNIICSNDIKEVTENKDVIFHVTPSKFARTTFKNYKEYIGNAPVVICSKGFEESTLLTLDQAFKQELPSAKIATLSGPSYATEVINNIPTAVILASDDNEMLTELAELLSNEYLRIYKSTDMLGVEIGGALKNILAFAIGICAELNFGTNAEAALMTRGLAEIAKLGTKMGAHSETFYGLSGLGDLILTCSSDESRNRRAGKLIAKGYSIEQTQKEIGQTIESIDNIKIALELAKKYDVEMPITNSAYDIVMGGLDPQEACRKLMTRTIKFENE